MRVYAKRIELMTPHNDNKIYMNTHVVSLKHAQMHKHTHTHTIEMFLFVPMALHKTNENNKQNNVNHHSYQCHEHNSPQIRKFILKI